jgi:sugar lactone lactonase YvrE
MVDLSSLRVISTGTSFPEGLRWRDGWLWFTDQFRENVHRVGPNGGTEHVATVPGRPAGLGWTIDGRLLAVAQAQRALVAIAADGGVSTYADLSAYMPAWGNDLVVDALGRAYVGNYGFDVDNGAPPATTRLIRVDPDGSISVEEPEFLFPNGAVLAGGGRTMCVAETFGDVVSVVDVHPDGTLSNRRVLHKFDDGTGPDGIAFDRQGRLWVALAFASRAVALNPDGTVADEVSIPGEGIYCCEVGGPDENTLYLAMAPLDEAEAESSLQGKIVAIDL